MAKKSNWKKVKSGLYAYVKNNVVLAFVSYYGYVFGQRDWVVYTRGFRSVHCLNLWHAKRSVEIKMS